MLMLLTPAIQVNQVSVTHIIFLLSIMIFYGL